MICYNICSNKFRRCTHSHQYWNSKQLFPIPRPTPKNFISSRTELFINLLTEKLTRKPRHNAK